ncbi:hypothetical protein [Haloglomus halophilum]|uniref:hypothetical protein n=1 Tax=Haloglomus halophilum TaxID=2962672 RepID=UPI0020C9916E|nr:hypothetical protein [Haloglomus halophilum]
MSATQNADEHSTVQPTEEGQRREPSPREAGFWAWQAGLAGLVFVGSVLSVGELPVLAVGIGLLALVVMLGTSLRAMAALEGGESA